MVAAASTKVVVEVVEAAEEAMATDKSAGALRAPKSPKPMRSLNPTTTILASFQKTNEQPFGTLSNKNYPTVSALPARKGMP